MPNVYLAWSKVNKKSWRDDGIALRDISVQLVERRVLTFRFLPITLVSVSSTGVRILRDRFRER